MFLIALLLRSAFYLRRSASYARLVCAFRIFLENVKKEFNMKFKDSVTDWVMPALLLTPHMVLLVAIWIEVNNPNNLQTVGTVITLLGVIVGAFGVWIAWQGLNTWKKSLTKPMELEIDLETEQQVKKVQDLANSYSIFINGNLYQECEAIKRGDKETLKLDFSHLEIKPMELMSEARKLSGLKTRISIKKRTHPSKQDSEKIIELCRVLINSTNSLKSYIENPILISKKFPELGYLGIDKKVLPGNFTAHDVINDAKVINNINRLCEKCVKELHEKWNN